MKQNRSKSHEGSPIGKQVASPEIPEIPLFEKPESRPEKLFNHRWRFTKAGLILKAVFPKQIPLILSAFTFLTFHSPLQLPPDDPEEFVESLDLQHPTRQQEKHHRHTDDGEERSGAQDDGGIAQ